MMANSRSTVVELSPRVIAVKGSISATAAGIERKIKVIAAVY
jgi:hypothetical protein